MWLVDVAVVCVVDVALLEVVSMRFVTEVIVAVDVIMFVVNVFFRLKGIGIGSSTVCAAHFCTSPPATGQEPREISLNPVMF